MLNCSKKSGEPTHKQTWQEDKKTPPKLTPPKCDLISLLAWCEASSARPSVGADSGKEDTEVACVLGSKGWIKLSFGEDYWGQQLLRWIRPITTFGWHHTSTISASGCNRASDKHFLHSFSIYLPFFLSFFLSFLLLTLPPTPFFSFPLIFALLPTTCLSHRIVVCVADYGNAMWRINRMIALCAINNVLPVYICRYAASPTYPSHQAILQRIAYVYTRPQWKPQTWISITASRDSRATSGLPTQHSQASDHRGNRHAIP